VADYTRYLGPRGASIEKGWRSVSKPALGHEMVGFDCRVNVVLVYPYGNSH
jgi:hypothetical protein